MSKNENFPLWEAASNFYRNYRELSGLAHENAFDSSEMIYQSTLALEQDREFRDDIRSRHRVILVDEFHESDLAHRKLLEALYSDELTLYVDPDSAIGRFRGADPESIPTIFDRYVDSSGNPARQITLMRDYRGAKPITDLAVAISQGFSLSRMSATSTSKLRNGRIWHRCCSSYKRFHHPRTMREHPRRGASDCATFSRQTPS